jgi:hypothetical protein
MSVIWNWDDPKLGFSADHKTCRCAICGKMPLKFPFFAWSSHEDAGDLIICNPCLSENKDGFSRDFMEISNPAYFGKGENGSKTEDAIHSSLMEWWEECVVFDPDGYAASSSIHDSYMSWIMGEDVCADRRFPELWEFLLYMNCKSEPGGWTNVRLKRIGVSYGGGTPMLATEGPLDGLSAQQAGCQAVVLPMGKPFRARGR